MAAAVGELESAIAGLGVECARHADTSEARVVASPRTVEEVAAVTRAANEREIAIEIVGAGTKCGWGNPVDAPIVLSTLRLSGVREHRWQDLTATVGAGTSWAAMQRELARHGQFVALDPLWPDSATVGGVIATNDSGALRLRYGSLRDLIIGMTIVLADGTIAKSGGKVVKNVAGYDLHKLMTGAYGTLGVIAEVTFRLHPLPAHAQVWSAASPDPHVLGFLMMQVLDSQLSVRAMQMRAGAEGYALDLGLASLPEVTAQQMERLNALARGCGGECVVKPDAAGDVFDVRAGLFRHDVVVKLTMLPGSVAALSRDVVRLGGTAVAQASGIMLAGFRESAAVRAVPTLYEYVETARGRLTLLQANKQPLPAWAIAPRGRERALPIMREVKRQFDAKRTLNPGRFVGGI